MTNCTICKHEQREAIETAIRGKASLRQTATQFTVSKDSVRRHQKHMSLEADPRKAEIPLCPYHGAVPFWLSTEGWVCYECCQWSGELAYFKMPLDTATVSATKAQVVGDK